MFKKLLVANRGTIAIRIIRACRELGISTVAVYSTADKNALHVRMADESVCIGPPAAEDSYLNIPAILSAATTFGADAVHPGYGFLSENGDFAEACQKSGLNFVGPRARHIRLMGDKPRARRIMKRAGVPVLPGSEGTGVTELREAQADAKRLGYPVLIKAAAGGGGKGMRVARDGNELTRLFPLAQGESEASFSSRKMYLEKYLERARHVEFQILADLHRTAIHLGERDCSIQRRHQKVIEESPCPILTPRLREKMGKAAVRAAEVVGYSNVGTVEFLLAGSGEFYFIEMNTRIQVEHGVTEMVTGVDLVKESIRMAMGEKLALKQRQVTFEGASMEFRIYAEDPERGIPSPGVVIESSYSRRAGRPRRDCSVRRLSRAGAVRSAHRQADRARGDSPRSDRARQGRVARVCNRRHQDQHSAAFEDSARSGFQSRRIRDRFSNPL